MSNKTILAIASFRKKASHALSVFSHRSGPTTRPTKEAGLSNLPKELKVIKQDLIEIMKRVLIICDYFQYIPPDLAESQTIRNLYPRFAAELNQDRAFASLRDEDDYIERPSKIICRKTAISDNT